MESNSLGAQSPGLRVPLLNDSEQREVEQRDPHAPFLSLPASQLQRLLVHLACAVEVTFVHGQVCEFLRLL